MLVAERPTIVQRRRVDDLALERVRAREARHVRLGEIAVAVDQEARGERPLTGVDDPALLGEIEDGAGDARVEPDVVQDPELGGHRP